MSGLLSGLNTARSGLNESQAEISLAAHNISNANTDGYTRQTLNLQSVSADNGHYRYSQGVTRVGNGVTDNGVTQVRNKFLDLRYRNAYGKNQDYEKQNDLYSQVEDIFNEFTTTAQKKDAVGGLSGQLSTLVSDLKKFQSTSDVTSLSSTVQGDVATLCQSIKNAYSSLTDLQSQELSNLKVTVKGDTTTKSGDGGINATLNGIQDLNMQIASYELVGQQANDLRDKRNALLDTLSGKLDITVSEESNGMVDVSLQNPDASGKTCYLIDKSNNVNTLDVYSDPDSGQVSVVSAAEEAAAAAAGTKPAALPVKGGEVDGYLQVLNGDGSGASTGYSQLGLPSMFKKLNNFAETFEEVVNSTVTYAGKTTGVPLVQSKHDGDATQPAAASISVSSGWTSNSDLFTQDYNAIKAYAAAGGNSIDKGITIGDFAAQLVTNLNSATLSTLHSANADGGLMLSDAAYNASAAGLHSGTVMEYADSFTSEIAHAVSSASGSASSTSDIVDDLDMQRQSVSGVSIDDEGINLIRYQQAYNASARVITVIDEMLDKLVNGTGVTT